MRATIRALLLLVGPGVASAQGTRDLEAAQEALARNEFDEAIRLATKGILATDLRFSQKTVALATRGTAYLEKNDGVRAYQDFDELVRANPAHATSLYLRSYASLAQGHVERWKRGFQTAQQVTPRRLPPSPPSFRSEYLMTVSSGISVSHTEGEFFGLQALTLAPTPRVTSPIFLRVRFESPSDAAPEDVVEVELAPGQRPLTTMGTRRRDIACGLYTAIVEVYGDPARTQRLATHYQPIRSTLDLRKLTAPTDMLLPAKC